MTKTDVKTKYRYKNEFHSGVTYFAQDPLRSYFDQTQKNEIYFLK